MFLPRSISYRRYAVSGRVPASKPESFNDELERTRFVPLGEDSQETEALGWTDFDNFLDTRFDVESHLEHGVLRLALRIDKRAVPSALVRAHMDLEKKARFASGDRKPSKRELAEIKEGVIAMLLPRIMPRTQVVKALWHLRDKMLYVLSTSETPCERLTGYFAHTFDGRSLTPLDPTALVGHLEETRPRFVHVDTIDAADFRPGGGPRRLRAGG